MKEALKLAQKALSNKNASDGAIYKALHAIKEALAQPEQEHVKLVSYNCKCGRTMNFESVHGVVAPQRTWVGLDEKDFSAINQSCLTKLQAATSAESILKEKNT